MRAINLDMIRELSAELAAYRDDDEATFWDTLDGETDAADVLDALIADQARDAALIDAIKAHEAQVKARRQRIEMRQDAARRLIGRVLTAAGTKKAERPLATVSVRDGNLSVRITDEGAVPAQLCTVKTITSPDKAAIKAQIEAGETVPGAELVRGDAIVTVRAS